MTRRYDNYILLLNESTADVIRGQYPQFKFISIGKKWMKKTFFFKYFFYMYEFKKNVNYSGVDLVFCPYGGPVACLEVKPKKICVIHDMQVRIDAKKKKKRDVWLYTKAEDLLMKNSSFVFTISNFSKKQILSFYPDDENKVINMSNSVSMVKNEYMVPMDLGCRYLLYCGRLYVQKNVMTLVKAFHRLSYDYSDLKLVLIAGENKYWEKTIKPYAQENNLVDKIILTGRCSEEELSCWYMGATCFVFPSIREGFGFPPIEAAYMNVPVVCSKADSLEEVTLGMLNYYEPPMDDVKLADEIKKVMDNPPSLEHLRRIGEEYERHYSIEVVGARICDFLEKQVL